MVPVAAEPPPTPSTDQTTPPLLAENCCGTMGVRVAVRGVTEKPAPLPVPAREMTCGLPGALSAIVMVAFRPPDALGEKVTLIAQFAPGAREVPQVVVWVKSSPPELDSVNPAMDMAVEPLFVSMTCCGTLLVPTT